MRRSLVFVLAGLLSGQVSAAEPSAEDLKKGQPPDVVALIDRLTGCYHWSGESPYDAVRRKEIREAMADLRCDRVARDEAAALKRHARNPRTVKALRQAETTEY